MMLSFNVYATEFIPSERGPHQGNIEKVAPFDISRMSKSEVFQKIEELYKKNKNVTQADYAKAEAIIDIYYKNNNNGNVPTRSDYDEGAAQLRTGNLIELTLDIDEGLSEWSALNAILLANSAKTEAQNNFPNTLDSARHFIWNYKMTDTYNALTARTVGINHEWGIIMIDPMITHYNLEYNDRINAGYSESDASSGALVDTILYIPEFKYLTVTLMENSYDFFAAMFSNDCIMDFWNNCYGRAYAQENYSSAVAAYTAAKNAGELILSSSNVSYNHKWSVWSWDWYWYTY